MNVKTDRLIAGIVVLLSCWASLLHAQPYHFAGGTGELNDPYQIATAEQLISIGSDPNLLDKHFILLNDIDLDPNLPGGRIFTKAVIAPNPIDRLEPTGIVMENAFMGTFDGRGYRIRNLIIHNGSESYYPALFGFIDKQGVVMDLGVDHAQVAGRETTQCAALAASNAGRIVRCSAEAHVSGGGSVGVLVGLNHGEIIDCWSAGEAIGYSAVGGLVGFNSPGVILRSHAASRVLSVEKNFKQFGGLVGWNYWGLVVGCYATGAVSARECSNLGGLIGEDSGMVVNSYATGDVSVEVSGAYLGGLVGYVEAGDIHDCYATGDVNGFGGLGGLVGRMDGRGHIANSYSTGQVSGSANSTAVGGLVGAKASGKISSCFWDTETSGLSKSAGGTGLTTAEMQNARTFIGAGWDWPGEQANGTADPWFIPERGGYPLLTAHSAFFQRHKLEGSGTANDPYRIATAEDLGAINNYDLGACYRLEADISLAGIAWHKAPIQYFEGRLDGAGKVVTVLRIEGDDDLGLFGMLGRQASVENLGIRDVDISGGTRLGVLAGENRGRITACCADGSVAGSGSIGGLIGWNEGSISDSYALGNVAGAQSPDTGGLTGSSLGVVRRCYAAAYVTSSSPSYYGAVTGGLVGANPYQMICEVYDSYFLIKAEAGGPDNHLGVALTQAQMKQEASFVGWDFDKTWTICEGKDYPRLRWENVQCAK